MRSRQVSLVLGGGGIRGLAHVGVLAALEDHHLVPAEVIGSSVGALVGAAWCAGAATDELRLLAHQIQRDDLFRIAHGDMALRRLRAPAIYRREPLADFVRGLLGDATFDDLARPLLVNTVDINTGAQVFWGSPGLRDVRVADAVIASCTMPGFLPPHRIGDRYFVDGAAAANLPVHPASRPDRDLVIAVDVSARARQDRAVQRLGFAAGFARGIELGIQRMDDVALRAWTRPPLLLVRPAVWHVELLSFRHNSELVEAGLRATHAVLDAPNAIPGPDAVGVYPRRRVRVEVLRDRCVGCGACVSAGPPGQFRLDDEGKAVATDPTPVWSPVDGYCVTQCPTSAIAVLELEPRIEAPLPHPPA
ncbi:MAG: patatin-like phospholipase family protein [Gemmatimonadota bacterium]|nr:patatin-like phospholipase family protein [Gemmatimonadota bacterium]MDH5197328.1 patatin-like phospholipase family protein [Gemmatimonadota bacterium]